MSKSEAYYNETAITISARGTIGFSCIRTEPFVPIVRLITIVPNLEIINVKYLKITFDALLNMTEGSSIPQLTIPSVKSFAFPLPPLAEQQRIVDAIEKAFEQIDIIEKNKLDLKTYVKQTKSKILDLAIRGKLLSPADVAQCRCKEESATALLEKIRSEKAELIKQKKLKPDPKSSIIIKAADGKHYEQFPDGTLKDIEDEIPFEIPEGWAWCRLPDVCAIPITDGTHKTPTYTDKEHGIPFISSKDVKTQVIDWSDLKYITKELHEELQKRICPKRNDVLLAKNGTIGFAALVETDLVFDIYVTLAVLRPCNGIYPKFLLHLINSPVCNKQFDSHLTGIGLPNLHLNDICKTLIPLPPLAEQQRIVEVIEKAFEQLDKIEKLISNYNIMN